MRMGWGGMGWDGIAYYENGLGWDEMGLDGMGWDECSSAKIFAVEKLVSLVKFVFCRHETVVDAKLFFS